MRTATIGPDLRLKTEHTATAILLNKEHFCKQQYFGHYFASWNSFALKLLKLFFFIQFLKHENFTRHCFFGSQFGKN